MKKLLIYLLLLPALAFGQISKKQIFFALASSGSSASTAIPDVDFTFKHIQRTNAAISLVANISGAPTVTSVVWQVRDKTGLLVGMGTSGLSESIPAITTRGFYDLYCWVKTATDQYPIEWEDAFYVNTPKFTEGEANLVINLASGNHYTDFAEASNPNYKIYIKGSGTGYVALLNLWGTSGNPVIIQKETGNTDITQTGISASDGLVLTGSRYVIFDGYNDDGTRGYNLVMPTGSLFGVRCENSKVITDLHLMGLDMDRTGATTDRAGISWIPPVNVTYNATNWISNNLAIYDCRINGSGAEGVYLNYTNDTPQSTYIPPKSRYVVIAWNEITDSGNDAIQWSSCIDVRVHHNFIDTWGLQQSASHENAFSWNEGNANCRVFSNFAINGKMGLNGKTGLTPYNVFASETTPASSPNYFYGNILIQGTEPGGAAEPVFNYFRTNGTSTNTYPFHFFNNTIVCNKLGNTIAFGSGGYRIPNLVWANNIIVKTGTSGDYSELDFTGAGTFPTTPTVNNLVRSYSSYSDILFVNGSGTTAADYEITSTSSPAYTGATDITTVVSGVDLIDYTGLPLNASGYAHGAYSGYDRKTITPTFNDAAAATFSSALAVGSLTEQGGTITFNANKEGLLYWTVVANNATAPTVAQVRAASGIVSGSILDPGTALTGTITGLSPSTAYDLYGVFVTNEDVAQAAVTKVDFTTTADAVAPTLSGWEITNAQPGRIYFNSSEVITATTFSGFTIAGIVGTAPTVTGVTINSGQTTGHYFTMSENFEAIDYLTTIAYSGSGSNLQDGATNALASFTATSVTNNITYSKRVNINITNFANNTGLSSWNDVDLAGNVSVRTLVANLDDINNAATGISFAITNAFHAMQNAVNATAGTYISNANAIVRGMEVYHTPDNSGTLRFAGLSASQGFEMIYLIKNTFGTGAGNINVNGAGAVGYTTGTVERKVVGTADGSGNVDWVMTQTTSNTSECVVAIIFLTK
jgi:hypothetical protein